ncbi:zinc-binding dehydrogenase [Streptomyces sp. NPDC015032]|uniref:zinc-binding dehydrogenase n=1 Tax=Streptomyces sp. NPDC015032 TaxID=3364937 RepID=UPI0036F70978
MSLTARVEGPFPDLIVLRHQNAASDIRGALPGGVPALIDGAALNAQALGAVSDGGALVSLKGWTGPTERGITIHPISSYNAATDPALLQRIVRQAKNGELPLRVGDLLPASRAAEAHQRPATGGVRGRLVLDFANPQW